MPFLISPTWAAFQCGVRGDLGLSIPDPILGLPDREGIADLPFDEGDPIPCLTVRQPWAAMIAFGVKPFENRGWSPDPHRGGELRWIGIHAGKAHAADSVGVETWCDINRAWPESRDWSNGPPAGVDERSALVALAFHYATFTAREAVELARAAGMHRDPTGLPVPWDEQGLLPGPKCWWFPIVYRFEKPYRGIGGAQSVWPLRQFAVRERVRLEFNAALRDYRQNAAGVSPAHVAT